MIFNKYYFPAFLLFLTAFSMATAKAEMSVDLEKAKKAFETRCLKSGPGTKHFFDCSCLADEYIKLSETREEKAAGSGTVSGYTKKYKKLTSEFRSNYGEKALNDVLLICDMEDRKKKNIELQDLSKEIGTTYRKVRLICNYYSKSAQLSKTTTKTRKPLSYELAMTRLEVKDVCISKSLINDHANTYCAADYKTKARKKPEWAKSRSEEEYCECYRNYYQNNIKRGGNGSKTTIRNRSNAMLQCSG